MKIVKMCLIVYLKKIKNAFGWLKQNANKLENILKQHLI